MKHTINYSIKVHVFERSKYSIERPPDFTQFSRSPSYTLLLIYIICFMRSCYYDNYCLYNIIIYNEIYRVEDALG